MTYKQRQPIEVSISSLTEKGNGLGKTIDSSQRSVEVPFTIPGDIVTVLPLNKRRKVLRSICQEINVPSPKRITPRCIHFASCGGCRWQQMEYKEQLSIKQDRVDQLFQELKDDQTLALPILPCSSPWRYRNKMEFSFSSDIKGNRYLGLMKNASQGKVLDLQECHLVNPWFMEALEATREWWTSSELQAYHPAKDSGSLRTLTVREGMHSGDRLVMLTVSGKPEFALNRHQLDSFTSCLRTRLEKDCRLSLFLRIQQAIKGQPTQFYEIQLYGPDHIRETLNVGETKLDLIVSPSAFFQPNTKQAENLYQQALELLDIPADSVVYDLYCGTGTLGLAAAKKAKLVVGIEISEESSLDGRTNAKNNHLDHVHILTGSVPDIIAKIQAEGTFPMPDIVIVDPPRAGLDPVTIQYLQTLQPKKILYISCNPTTQAQNVKILCDNGYRLAAIQPVDQFPHTPHTENIVVLDLFRK